MNFAIVKRVVLVGFSLLFIWKIAFFTNAENAHVYSSSEKNSKKIAITFDDGPHPGQTDRILNVLEKYGVKATFFVVGINVENYPKPLNNVISKGHEVGNHTYFHTILKGLDKGRVEREIDSVDEKILDLYGYKMKLLRPPCGSLDNTLINVADEKNLKIVLWNIDTKDWAHTSTNDMVKNVLKNVKGGDIILFHDYISGKSNTCNALEKLIPKLQAQGYEFVTVSELLQEE